LQNFATLKLTIRVLNQPARYLTFVRRPTRYPVGGRPRRLFLRERQNLKSRTRENGWRLGLPRLWQGGTQWRGDCNRTSDFAPLPEIANPARYGRHSIHDDAKRRPRYCGSSGTEFLTRSSPAAANHRPMSKWGCGWLEVKCRRRGIRASPMDVIRHLQYAGWKLEDAARRSPGAQGEGVRFESVAEHDLSGAVDGAEGTTILDRLDSTTQLLKWANNCVGLQQRR
jgi:hypothetical protein